MTATLGSIVAGGIGATAFGVSWQFLSGIALLASATVLAFLYIWAVLFRNQGLNEFVKLEVFELFGTTAIVMLVVFFAAVFASMDVGGIIPSSLMPKGLTAGTNVYDACSQYFVDVDRDMSGWLEMNYMFNVYMDSMASVTPYSRPLGVGLVASPLAGFASPIKQLLYNMSVALSVAYIINWAQLRVFEFAVIGFLKYYLPVGIFLRSFTPTRRIGGTLIGLAMTFLFVFPILQIATYGMLYNDTWGPMVTFRSFVSGYLGGQDYTKAVEDFFTKTLKEASFIDMVTMPFTAIGGFFKTFVTSIFTGAMTIPMSIVGLAFAIGYIAPAFNVLMLVQAGRYLSRTLGEEIDISQLTRMI